jgi:iron complex transport system permease protein
MLLAGIALNALAQAGASMLTFLANDAQIRSISFWRLGSLSGATWGSVRMVAPFIVVAVAALPFFSTALNTLLLVRLKPFIWAFPWSPSRI